MLSGITRDSVLTLARHFGIPVVEQAIPREMIYIADEVFFTGTAAEVTPIRSVDRIQIGDGSPEPDHEPAKRGVHGDCLRAEAGSLRLADAGAGDRGAAGYGVRTGGDDEESPGLRGRAFSCFRGQKWAGRTVIYVTCAVTGGTAYNRVIMKTATNRRYGLRWQCW